MSSEVSSFSSIVTALSIDSTVFSCDSPVGKNSFSYSPCNPSPVLFKRGDEELFFKKTGERREPSISVEDVTSDVAKRALRKLCRDWKKASFERLSTHRAEKNFLQEKKIQVLNKPASEGKEEEIAQLEEAILSSQKNLSEDKLIIENYAQLCNSMDGILEKQLDDPARHPAAASKHFRVLMDQEGNSQCVAMYSITKENPGLYLDYMITSAHNLALRAKDSEGIAPFRGGGTIMLHSLYESAKMQRLPLFYLKPADQASSEFYEKIGMMKGADDSELKDHYYFHVTDAYPGTLQAKLHMCISASFGEASGK